MLIRLSMRSEWLSHMDRNRKRSIIIVSISIVLEQQAWKCIAKVLSQWLCFSQVYLVLTHILSIWGASGLEIVFRTKLTIEHTLQEIFSVVSLVWSLVCSQSVWQHQTLRQSQRVKLLVNLRSILLIESHRLIKMPQLKIMFHLMRLREILNSRMFLSSIPRDLINKSWVTSPASSKLVKLQPSLGHQGLERARLFNF